MENRIVYAVTHVSQNVFCFRWLVGNAFHATRMVVKSAIKTGIVPLRNQLVMETVQRSPIAVDPRDTGERSY